MIEHPSEAEEWERELLISWIETFKRAMTTPVTLRLIAAHQPVSASQLAKQFPSATGWQLTERGLYRTLKRLESQGLLEHTVTAVPRTGASRKDFSLTSLGRRHLIELERQIALVAAEPADE